MQTSHFEKDFFKLANNSVLGKSKRKENVRKYVDIKLFTTQEKFAQLSSNPQENPRSKSSVVFNNELDAVTMNRDRECLCKPIYVGFIVLDSSKTINV